MNYRIGLDIGITSVGWAVINLDIPRIEDLGVRIFDKAEGPNGDPLALPRRQARSSRRRLRRRKHRLERIKRLIVRGKILSKAEINELYKQEIDTDVWILRVEALERKLNREEMARVLIHLAKRRGFKSNRKSEASENDTGELLINIKENKIILKNYRSVADMMVHDRKFAEHKRNKSDFYLNTIARDDLEKEIDLIFLKQKEFMNPCITEKFIQEYKNIWSSHRPFASKDDIDKLVGFCTFEIKEKRAPKATFAFQSFVAIDNILKVKLVTPENTRDLTPEERQVIFQEAFNKSEIKYSDVRKLMNLDDEVTFKNIVYNKEKTLKQNENVKLLNLDAFHKVQKVLSKVYGEDAINLFNPIDYDTFGYALTIFKDDKDIYDYLKNIYINSTNQKVLNLANKVYEDQLIEALIAMTPFKKFGHLSLKALNKITPYMMEGNQYDKACSLVGYEFTGPKKKKRAKYLPPIEKISNPVVIRALTQARKVVNAIIRKYGSPLSINIELARELSRDHGEREKIKKAQGENRKKNETAIQQLIEYELTKNPGGLDIVKIKLYSEQQGKCMYSLKPINIERLLEPGYVEVDHILPYSRSLDDSYSNKVLVFTEENRKKGNRTPAEYFYHDKNKWLGFESFIQSNKSFNFRKKQNLLRLHYNEREEADFKERNLNDTRYATKFFANFIKENLLFAESDSKKKVHTINGKITAHLRSRWDFNKNREESNLHHAVDAVIVACTTDWMIEKITNFYKTREQNLALAKRNEPYFPQPWHGFSYELKARLSNNPKEGIKSLNLGHYDSNKIESLKSVFVSRMPKRGVTGPAHEATLRKVVGTDEKSKKTQTAVKTKLINIKLDKDGHFPMFGKEKDPYTYNTIRQRLLEYNNDPKRAFHEPIYKPKRNGEPGNIIRTIKVIDTTNQYQELNNGKAIAYNSNIVRTDVFEKDGKYYCVPIYRLDLIRGRIPNKAINANKPYSDWIDMTAEYTFLFSLYPNDLVRITLNKEKNEKDNIGRPIVLKDFFVYYNSIDAATAGLIAVSHDNSFTIRGLGSKTLKRFEKYQVDVLGNITKVKGERRVGLETFDDNEKNKVIN